MFFKSLELLKVLLFKQARQTMLDEQFKNLFLNKKNN